MPIQVPPGIQGLQPALALVYNNQATGGSTIGVGWRLSGQSRIARCGQNKLKLYDELTTSVNYTVSDRLCLDGTRLVPRGAFSTQEQYWAAGQTYSKELEDFSHIVPSGSCDGGPCELRVHTPNGRTMIYGGSPESQLRAVQTTDQGTQPIREWLLREVQDGNGNAMSYRYSLDRGHARLNRIDYSGHRIHFDHLKINEASDQVIATDGTGEWRIRMRLSRIRMSVSGNITKTNHLTYGRSLLKRVEECDANVCLDPLDFTWNETAADGRFRVVTPVGGQYQDWLRNDPGANIIPGDFNGDGKTDFIRQEKGGWDDTVNWGNFMVWFSHGDGHFSYVTPQTNGMYQNLLRYGPGSKLITGDYNGDGKTDFIRMSRAGWGSNGTGHFAVYFSRGDGYFDIATTTNGAHQSWLRDEMANYYTGDFNGDGRTDFIKQERNDRDDDATGTFAVYVSRGDGWFDIKMPAGNEYQYNLKSDDGAFIIPGDFDGDGRSDFIRQEHSGWDNETGNSFNVYFANRAASTVPVENIATIQQGPVTHTFDYRRLSEYDANDGVFVNFRNRHFRGSLSIVSFYGRRLNTSAENGSAVENNRRTFDFQGASMSNRGRGFQGFQGFQKMIVTAPEEGSVTTTEYCTNFPCAGSPTSVTLAASNGDWISRVANDLRIVDGATHRSTVSRLHSQEVRKYFAGNISNLKRSDFQYDAFGNLVLLSENDSGRLSQTCSTYANNAALGLPGPLTGSVQGTGCSVSGNSCSCSNRLTEFRVTHDGSGNVIQREDYDDSRGAWLATSFDYDSRGNRIRATTPTGAVETTTYESTYHTYPETITTSADGKSFTETREYDPRHGTVTEEVDGNGAVRRATYDSFGRLLSVHRTGPQGLVLTESHSYQRQGDSYVDLSQTRQAWDDATMTAGNEYTDGLGRVIRQDFGSGADQREIISVYNARGDLVRKSIPYASGLDQGWTIYTYNQRHRVSAIAHPTGANSTINRTIGGVCASGQLQVIQSTTNSGDGQPRSQTECKTFSDRTLKLVLTDVTTGASITQTTTLDALDRLRGVSDGQSSTTIELDSLGRRTRISSSDSGVTEYEYNAQGLVEKEIRNGETKTIVHDGFGRATQMVFHDGSQSVFEYDDPAFTGSQARMTAAVMLDANGQEKSRREYSYDAQGEASVVRLSLDGGSGGIHVMQYATDPHGRPQRIQYPSGRLACYEYDAVGDLSQIKGATGDCSQTPTEVCAAYSNYTKQGQPGRIVYGNGVATDYTYDHLNRVQSIRTTDSGNLPILDQQYAWTALNEVDAISDQLGTNGTDYSYNSFGYLTRAVGP